MRRRKNRRRKIGNMSIIYISTILALSFMGVGYAAWNDGLSVAMNITTANATTLHELKYDYDVLSLRDGELTFHLSEDKKLLVIEGEVYPGFVENIELSMKDEEGGIPTKLIEINIVSEAEIAEVKEEKQVSYRGVMGRMSTFSTNSFGTDDVTKTIQLNINSNKADNSSSTDRSMRTMNISTFGEQGGEIERLKNEINSLKHEIGAYNQVEEYEFEYHFVFEQSI